MLYDIIREHSRFIFLYNLLFNYNNYKLIFCSKDTVIALKALTEYCYRERIREITNINIEVESSSSPGSSQIFTIANTSISTMHRFQVIFFITNN